jgi:TonB family protein
MIDAEPKSTHSTIQDLESADGQPSTVAVSEENLAALLRATISPAEPEAQRPVEGANAAPAIDANQSIAAAPQTDSSRPAAVTNPPAKVVESRLALFAAVKENRSAISRSALAPATPLLAPATTPLAPATPLIEQSPTGKENAPAGRAEQHESVSVSPAPKVAPRRVILPETVSRTPAPVAPITTPSSIDTSHIQSDKTTRARLVIGLVVAAVIVTVGVYVFSTRAHPSKAPSVVASAPKDNVPLQVRVEPLGKGLIDVRWNPQSVSVAQARDGRLVITEPNQKPRTLALEAAQLKTGHLTYQSAAESIEFDLEIVDSSGAIVKESVLALQSPAASPPVTGTPPQTPLGQTAPAKPQTTPNYGATAEIPQLSQPKVQAFALPTTQQNPEQHAVAEVPQRSQPSVRTFVAPVAQRNTEQSAIVDAPPALTNGPAMPTVGLPVQLPAILPPSTKAVQQQVRVESTVEAANLIKKVIPNYPQIARAARIQGTVRFTAHIGKDGRVLNLKFTSGPSVLVDSASAAVKQWLYRPTLLDGQPVEVITQIDVNFTLNQNVR